MNNNLKMSCVYNSHDYKIIQKIVDMGIDSRLEGFTDSDFHLENKRGFYRLFVTIAENELSIFMRRLSLLSYGHTPACNLENDILFSYYGIEIV